MSGPPHPYVGILTSPPFYTTPGINPASPVSTQAEQMDQLNTLLLQAIDANFARVHQLITTRILPEMKRFALASEPTRRSAEFWDQFYLKAAGTEHENEDTTLPSLSLDRTEEVSASQSFMSVFEPGVHSTPLPTRRDPSWDASDVESPFAKVDRDLTLHAEDSSVSSLSVGGRYAYGDASTGTVETSDLPQYANVSEQSHSHTEPPEFKSYAHESRFRPSDSVRSLEPSRASSTTLHRSTATLRESTRSRPAVDDDSDTGETPRATHFPQGTPPRGPRASHALIDLTATPLNIAKFSRTAVKPPVRDLLEDSDDMAFSPMQFTLPPRAAAMLETARPQENADREQTEKLGDLLADLTANLSPSPAKLPDFMRRYSVLPTDGRRLFDTSTSNTSTDSPNIFAPVHAPRHEESPFNPDTYAPGAPRRSMANTSFGSDLQSAQGSPGRAMSDEEELDSFDDDTLQIRQAEVAAVEGFAFDDDSYLSDDSYRREVTDTHVGAEQPDSGVFGRPAGARGMFALHQQDEMRTFHGGKLEDAVQPGTPLGGNEGDISSLGPRR